MKSLYAQFVEEHRGFKILENQYGFATYNIEGEACYIADIFVTSEKRRSGVARGLCFAIRAIAKEAGCKVIIGSVDPLGKTANDGLKLIMGMDMELTSIQNGLIFFALKL